MRMKPAVRSVYKIACFAWLLFWLLMVSVAVQDHLRSGNLHVWEPIFWESSSLSVSLLIFYLQRHILFDRPLLQRPRRWFWSLVRLQPLVCIFFVITTFSLRHLVYGLLGLTYRHDPWWQLFLYESIKLSFFYGVFYVNFFGVQTYILLLEEKENAEQSQQLLHQAQVQRLTQQMQPHFLFNALNTVSSLMYSDLRAADSALSRLAELLRHTLDFGEATETTVERELQILRAYAELMQLRFVDRVELIWEIDAAAMTCIVPTMCLQPLLENTFKHTVEKRSGMTHITVQITRDIHALQMSVQDDVGILSQGVTGIGLANLRQRLTVLYGERGQLMITSCEPAGVKTTLTIAHG